MTDTEILDWIDQHGPENFARLCEWVERMAALSGSQKPAVREVFEMARTMGWLGRAA